MRSYTYQELQDRFKVLGFQWPKFHLVGIRSKEDKPNYFDDLFYLIDDGNITQFKGTTNPGDDVLLAPKNSKGAAILEADKQYIDTWKPGIVGTRHEQFLQVKPITVFRDNNKDLKSDENGPKDTGYFGINIHRYNATQTFDKIDGASEGCQVFWNPVEFNNFLAIFKSTKLDFLTYTLLREF